jgi:hypothetical protein
MSGPAFHSIFHSYAKKLFLQLHLLVFSIVFSHGFSKNLGFDISTRHKIIIPGAQPHTARLLPIRQRLLHGGKRLFGDPTVLPRLFGVAQERINDGY